jgi:hypothetical protein
VIPRRRPQTGHASPEQLVYARRLAGGTRIGLAVLLAAFLAYVTGLLPAYVPLADLPTIWHLSARGYLAAAGVPAGWGWLTHVAHGEFASLAGIGILAGCSLASLAAVLLRFLRHGDRAYAAMTLALLAVIVLAASGLLNRLHA